jgi:hypothetical protein
VLPASHAINESIGINISIIGRPLGATTYYAESKSSRGTHPGATKQPSNDRTCAGTHDRASEHVTRGFLACVVFRMLLAQFYWWFGPRRRERQEQDQPCGYPKPAGVFWS